MRYSTNQPYEPLTSNEKLTEPSLSDLYRESIEEYSPGDYTFDLDFDEMPEDNEEECPAWVQEQIDEDIIDDEIPF